MRLVPPIHAVAINVVYFMFLTCSKVIFAMSAHSRYFCVYDYLRCKKTRLWPGFGLLKNSCGERRYMRTRSGICSILTLMCSVF